ncbi:ABC transporter permease [Lentzea sp. NPDC006480]|uniref:ABC transporter permease n=1 Tax=Lentzea sp. NPDC006480 TaxID=3157176 RepID=UPI0033B759E2
MSVVRTAAEVARFQATVLRRSPGDLMVLVNTPLLTVIFLAITRHAGRTDLDAYSVLAPAVMALWSMAVIVSGEIISRDRAAGTLELLLASPASITLVVSVRILVVTVVSLVALAEAWLVATFGFGVRLVIHHPAAFGVTLLVTAAATAGWASAMSGIFVLARSARTFQNSISYPFFLLGGVVVPTSLLPGWLQPVCDAVYLSWASDLLRDATKPAAVTSFGGRLGVVALLGLAGFALGHALLRATAKRVRGTGEVAFA